LVLGEVRDACDPDLAHTLEQRSLHFVGPGAEIVRHGAQPEGLSLDVAK
jgi:hypothetical protein